MATTPLWPASSSSELPGSEARARARARAPELDLRRARLLLAYLGTNFHGFAVQDNQRTVAGELSQALERVLRHPVELTCAGRTDAGVHAWGQVVSLDVPAGADLERLQRSLNKMLGPEVTVREVAWAEEGFDARRSAISRTYRYNIDCSPWPSPFRAGLCWNVGAALDVRGMQAAADAVLGENDFSSFCHAVKGRPGPIMRNVMRAEWSELGGEQLRFEIQAGAFCHQMVRSIVGALVEIGQGRRKAGEMRAVLRARDRGAAGQVAPPHGLCLWEVGYPPPALAGSVSPAP